MVINALALLENFRQARKYLSGMNTLAHFVPPSVATKKKSLVTLTPRRPR
jgi:hypothetical protein